MPRLRKALVVLEVTYDANTLDHPRDWSWHLGIGTLRTPEGVSLLCSADLPMPARPEEAA